LTVATFNFKSAGPAASDWSEKRLKHAKSVEPNLDHQTTTHHDFCQRRAAWWLGRLTEQQKNNDDDS